MLTTIIQLIHLFSTSSIVYESVLICSTVQCKMFNFDSIHHRHLSPRHDTDIYRNGTIVAERHNESKIGSP